LPETGIFWAISGLPSRQAPAIKFISATSIKSRHVLARSAWSLMAFCDVYFTRYLTGRVEGRLLSTKYSFESPKADFAFASKRINTNRLVFWIYFGSVFSHEHLSSSETQHCAACAKPTTPTKAHQAAERRHQTQTDSALLSVKITSSAKSHMTASS